ncbi:MAG: hypothetical protein KDA89_11705 [Planctomycetaceae bacterium]|nr:hypothetical protein [Planctomycetaceae bacterium]
MAERIESPAFLLSRRNHDLLAPNLLSPVRASGCDDSLRRHHRSSSANSAINGWGIDLSNNRA